MDDAFGGGAKPYELEIAGGGGPTGGGVDTQELSSRVMAQAAMPVRYACEGSFIFFPLVVMEMGSFMRGNVYDILMARSLLLLRMPGKCQSDESG